VLFTRIRIATRSALQFRAWRLIGIG